MTWKSVTRRAANAIKKVYPRFGLRDSDILLASFPKSGNTWVRFIWANMVSLTELGGREIDFGYLNTELVAEYDSHSYGEVEFDCLPRLVKTHRLYDPRAYGENRSIYVVRHPGDVAISYFEYQKAKNGRGGSGSDLKAFIRDPEYGVPAWCEHVRSWRSRADIVIKYEELKTDAVMVLERVLRRFGLVNRVDDAVVKHAVERSSFDKLKDVEEEKGRPKQDRFDSKYRFMRRGNTGEWEKRFDESDIDYLREKTMRADLDELYAT
jgi:hypothetical protein